MIMSKACIMLSFKISLFSDKLNINRRMGCCKSYCMWISAFSVFFLLYLFFLVAFNSQTLYIQVHNRMATAFALFISAAIYGGIFGYLYYDIYINVDRKEELKRWVEQRKNLNNLKEKELIQKKEARGSDLG